MNKLEEIDRLQKVITNSDYFGENNDELMLAQDILDASYGNVKQAVKEFAEKLKEKMELNGYRSPLHNRIIDNLITELYGADQ